MTKSSLSCELSPECYCGLFWNTFSLEWNSIETPDLILFCLDLELFNDTYLERNSLVLLLTDQGEKHKASTGSKPRSHNLPGAFWAGPWPLKVLYLTHSPEAVWAVNATVLSFRQICIKSQYVPGIFLDTGTLWSVAKLWLSGTNTKCGHLFGSDGGFQPYFSDWLYSGIRPRDDFEKRLISIRCKIEKLVI